MSQYGHISNLQPQGVAYAAQHGSMVQSLAKVKAIKKKKDSS